MKKFLLLARTLRKMGSGTKEENGGLSMSDGLALALKILFGVLLAVGAFFLGTFLGSFEMYRTAPETLFSAMFFAVSACLAMLAFLELLGTLYMSADLPVLMSLPFSTQEIVFARTLNAGRGLFCYSTAMIVPFGIGFALSGAAAGAAYIAGLVLAVVLVPLVSLVFAGLIVILIMSAVKLLRNRETLRAIGAVFAVVIGCAIGLTRAGAKTDAGAAVEKVLGMTKGAAWVFPETPLLSKFLSGGNALYALLAVAVSAALVALFALASGKLFLSGALKMQDSSASRTKLSGTALSKACKKRAVSWSYTMKDVKMILRDSSYMSNGWLSTLVWPVFLLSGFLGSGEENIFSEIGKNLSDPAARPLLLFSLATGVAVVAGTSTTGLSGLAGSTVNREGASFYYMKTIPVPFVKQVLYKRNAALVISSIGGVGYILIGGLVLSALGLFSVPYTLYAAALSALIMTGMTNILTAGGLKRLNLGWESVNSVLKPRVIGLVLWFAGLIFGMIFSLAGSALLILIDETLGDKSMFVPVLIVLAVFAVLTYLTSLPVRSRAKKLENIQ